MPILIYPDDIFFVGSRADFRLLCFYATYYAVEALDIDALVLVNYQDPSILYFFPANPSPLILERFLFLFAVIFDVLCGILESHHSSWVG